MTDSPDTRTLQTVCPAGEPIYALQLALGPKGKTVCYAATSAGLFAAEDGRGDTAPTWNPLFASLALPGPLPTTSVATSPQHPADGFILAGTSGAILRSTDRGATWQIAQLPTPPPIVVALASSPNFEEDAVVFAATAEDGVFRSSDGGRSWVAWNFGLLDLNLGCLAVSPGYATDETLFAGAESGVYRSTNGARAWRELAFPVDAAPVLSLAISEHFAVDGTVWAGSEMGGLFVSRDEGETWRCLLDGEIGPINGLVVAPTTEDGVSLLVLTGRSLRQSEDGGITWRDLSDLQDDEADATCLAFEPGSLTQGRQLYVGRVDGTVTVIALPVRRMP